jgi:type IV secretory pathway VirJ component
VTLRIPLCEVRGLKTRPTGRGTYALEPYPSLKVPWIVLQSETDRVCPPASPRGFAAATGSSRFISLAGAGRRGSWTVPTAQLDEAYRLLTTVGRAAETPPAPIPDTSDLSLVEVPAASPSASDVMAVLLTGDGGWAELDKSVAAGLAAAGVPTVGWSSLRYFWSAKTPEHAAADLARIIARYTSKWNKRSVILIGYSFGAEVLPFLITRLPAAVRQRIADVTLLGPGPTAAFEFHVAEWFGGSKATTYRIVPEVEKLSMPVTCVQGEGESGSACPSLEGGNIRTITIGDGHHFGGEYGRVVDVILRRP